MQTTSTLFHIMNTIALQYPCVISTISFCNRKIFDRKERIQRHRKQIYQSTNTNHFFAKPTPTPLLINPKPYPESKFQALNAVLDDIEKSIKRGLKVDAEIFASLLETCYNLQTLEHGIRIHKLIPIRLLQTNIGLSSKLVRLYASNGQIEKAHQVFDEMFNRDASAFVWNALISGYAEMGLYEDAMAVYLQMDEQGVDPDEYTFPRVLKACGGIGSIKLGERVHRDLVRSGFAYNGFVLNALVDMYAKCGDIVKARNIFIKIVHRDLVSWNSMLTGYIRHGLFVEAVDVLRWMIQEGFNPDYISISAILSGEPSLTLGKQVHGWVIRQGIDSHLSVANSLVAVYSNHGKLDQSRWLFNQMLDKDFISWNSIISAHSKDPKSLIYLEQMQSSGVSPDGITFVSVLSACAHLGLVDEAERLFAKLRSKYRIKPSMEHYACMVNLYGRAGLVKKAYEIVLKTMEFEAGPTVWGALLYACQIHGNVDIGEVAAQRLFELEPDNEQNFEILMKIYSNAGKLDEMERIRYMMVERGLY